MSIYIVNISMLSIMGNGSVFESHLSTGLWLQCCGFISAGEQKCREDTSYLEIHHCDIHPNIMVSLTLTHLNNSE